MAYISKINVGGTIYDIKDAEARQLIQGGVKYIGRTTTALVDEATTSPITIGSSQVTPEVGNLVIYNAGTTDNPKDLEFIWNGEHWDELGSTGKLGDLAYKNSAEGTINWFHSHTPDFEDAEATFTGTTDGVAAGEASITPAGSITVDGTEGTEYTPTGEVTISDTTSKTVSGGTSTNDSEQHMYTPAGNVTCSGVTVTGTVEPEFFYKYTSAMMSLSDPEMLILETENVSNKCEKTDISATAKLGTFTFTGVQALLSHSGHTHALAGTVSVPSSFTFTGTPTKLGFTGTAAKHTHTITQGTVSGKVTYKKVARLDTAGTEIKFTVK